MTEHIEYCTSCVTPSTRPRITFNEDGLCNACRFGIHKQDIDWELKEKELRTKLDKILAAAPSREYDCLIPVSGGKDSHYQSYFAKNVLGLNPLCVTFTPLLQTGVGRRNLRNLVERVGVDHISINANPQTYAKITRIMLEEHGDPFKPFLYGVFSGCAQVAIEKKIPLFFYGENGETEYGGSEDELYENLDSKGVHARIRSDRPNFLTPDQWTEYGLSAAQTRPFQEPAAEDIEKVERLFLADYVPWNNNHHLHVALNVIGGFKLPDERTCGTYTHGSGIDDALDEIYLWLTWPKFGYGRATKYAAKDIREGKLTRERAVELIRLYDGEFPWHVFDLVLNALDMKESEFWDVVRNHIGDAENLAREPEKIPSWERVGENKWRHLNTVHGEERVIELPIKRPES